MSYPTSGTVRAAQIANRSLADRSTPFIYDEWYVVAFAAELDRTLRRRKILGRNIVLFRTLSGKPVALDDRCIHRSFPLSRSTLDGDTVVCGYHGMRYDALRACIEIPSQATCPKGVGIRAYPLIERGPLVWIWMGEPAQADPLRIPTQPWIESASWARSQGCFALPASYVSLHENLMDLTHLSYLHAQSFGTADHAKAPYDVLVEDGHFVLNRRVVPTTLPPVWAEPTGIRGNTAARIVDSEFVSPGFHLVTARFHDMAVSLEQRREFTIKTAHLPTPETQTSTHYFIVHGRDFALESAEVTRFMHDQLFTAFAEDVAGLSAIESNLAGSLEESVELSFASDRASVAVRKYLKKRATAPLACARASE